MGLLALPTMLRRNYSPAMAAGTIAASGTLGQIIPPSIVLVVLADVMNISVGDLFMGAVFPGFILVGLYIFYIIIIGYLRPDIAPAIPAEELSAISRTELTRRAMRSLVPPLSLMIAVLGSIFAGIASPTEAAAVGASAAMVLVMFSKKFSYAMIRGVMHTTVRLTSMVFIILVGAQAFGLTFRGLGGDDLIREFITALELSKWGVLAIVMLTLFLAGFFLDFIEITFIHVPVLAPLMVYYGFNPVWFAVLIAVNLQTSFLTPPFGYALFYLKSVSPPSVTTAHIYKGIVPFVILQLIGLSIVVAFPKLVLWLPCQVFSSQCP
jgi:tripartite ATP-independent transporter DctM subunit